MVENTQSKAGLYRIFCALHRNGQTVRAGSVVYLDDADARQLLALTIFPRGPAAEFVGNTPQS